MILFLGCSKFSIQIKKKNWMQGHVWRAAFCSADQDSWEFIAWFQLHLPYHTPRSFIISFQTVAEPCTQMLWGNYGVVTWWLYWVEMMLNPWWLLSPSLPSRSVTIHCPLTLGTMMTPPSSGWPGCEEIWNAAGRLGIVHSTPSQYPISFGQRRAEMNS